MNIFSQLRIVVLLRRAVRALESLAESQSTLAKYILSRETRLRERRERRRAPRPTSFETMDTQAIEDAYLARQRAERMERG